MGTTEHVLRILDEDKWVEYERERIRVLRTHPTSEILWEGEARDLARKFEEQQAELERLRVEHVDYCRNFIDRLLPKVDGYGWVQRDTERAAVVRFLDRVKAAEENGVVEFEGEHDDWLGDGSGLAPNHS